MLLHDHVDRWAAQRPHGEFAVQGDRRATWAQARDASARAARRLRLAGLGPGDRCAVLARNAIEYLVLQVAASRAGVVLVPLNPRSTATEWDHVVHDARRRCWCAGPGSTARRCRRCPSRASTSCAPPDRRPRPTTPAPPSCCASTPEGRRAVPGARR